MGNSNMAAISMRKQEEQWRTESDLEALIRAEEIRKDPQRMKKVRALARKRLKQTEAATNVVAK